MKRTFFAAAAFLLSACADTTAPTGLQSPRAGSNDVDQNVTVPSTFDTINPCNGDAVALTGTIHMLVHSTTASSGNLSSTIDFTGQYSGVGAPSLVSYNGYTRYFESYENQNPFPIVEHLISSFDVKSATAVDNFSVTVDYKITINANGVPTAEIQDVKNACNG